MIALVLGWLAPIWARLGATILKWGAIALLVLGAIFYVRHSGKVAERAENMAQALRASAGRKALEREIESLPDADLDDQLRAPNQRKVRRSF